METLHARLIDTWCYFLYVQECAEKLGVAEPSTAPCTPAPGRCLLILRDDVQAARGGMFLSFEGILSSSTKNNINPYEKNSERELLSWKPCCLDGSSERSRIPAPYSKRRWRLLRSILPFNTTTEGNMGMSHGLSSDDKPENIKSGDSPLPGTTFDTEEPPANESQWLADSSLTAHRALSFKFSLEWISDPSPTVCRNRDLQPPGLPLPAQMSRQQQLNVFPNFAPLKPEGAAVGYCKYAGRALAEWEGLIAEFQAFFARRRNEGVPSYHLVETPLLSVEPFRKV